jgi:vacuolar-type H+-ATPase subunit F/Vma7
VARIVALVDEETGLGFRLAGIGARAVATPEEMGRRAESLLGDPETGVVILDESLFRRLPESLQRRLEESTAPVFVPVPAVRSEAGPLRPEEYVARLMRRVTGYRIRIRR